MIEFLAPIQKFVRDLATDYTTARAAKLDHLDADISAISPIRSIQRGTVLITNGNSTNTATITSVTTAKSQLTLLGTELADPSSGLIDAGVRLALTNSTTITATRGGALGGITVGYQVTEFK